MGFQQGLSGLNAAAKNLDVIGNNVANANTVGFKMSKAEFADIYASSVGGAAGTAIGIGTKVSNVSQQFAQGNITATNNPLDIAINGQGFFQIGPATASSAQFYTRNGQFQMDNQGYMVTAEGMRLFGKTQTGVPGAIQVPTTQIPARATGSSANPNVVVGLNVDSRGAVTANPAIPFNPADPTTYNNSTSTTIYDSLGNPHIATLYFQKDTPTAANNPWNVFLTIDNALQPAMGTPVVPATVPPTVAGLNQLLFDANGKLPAGSMLTMSAAFVPTGSLATLNQLTFDFSNPTSPSTQYGSAFGVSTLIQDGYTTGLPNGFTVGPDGTILGRYTNGQSQKLGQVEIANFANPQGLQPLGNNRWAATSVAGQALPGAPGTASLGVLQSGAVEEANVDLTAELVSMIVAQRVYQANAQSIKTQDAVLQTITNLR